MKRWDRLMDLFMEEYEARGLAQGSIDAMQREWEKWGCWLKRRRPRPKLEEVSVDLINGYIRSRCRTVARSTHYGVMSRIQQIGDFLVQESVWPNNPLAWMKRPRLDRRHRLPRRIAVSDLDKIWESAASCRCHFYRYTWVTILSIYYGTALRRNELVRLNLADWDSSAGTLLIRKTKTRRERLVQLPPLAWKCLEAYLPRRENQLLVKEAFDQRALFVNLRGERLSKESVTGGTGRIMKRAGVKATLHQLRHTCASEMLSDGVKLPHLKRLLGHQSIGTTMRYLHIEDAELARAIERHPINMLGNILNKKLDKNSNQEGE